MFFLPQLSADEMQVVSPVLSSAITAMIDNTASLFTIPTELGDDVANFWREMEDPNKDVFTVDKENLDNQANIQKAKVNIRTCIQKDEMNFIDFISDNICLIGTCTTKSQISKLLVTRIAQNLIEHVT